MKLQVEQAKEHIGKKFPYSYTMPSEELGSDVVAFPWRRHDITISPLLPIIVQFRFPPVL